MFARKDILPRQIRKQILVYTQTCLYFEHKSVEHRKTNDDEILSHFVARIRSGMILFR